MSNVFVNIGLDDDMAPEGRTMEHFGHVHWGATWSALMGWIVSRQHLCENLKFGPGGGTGPLDDLVRRNTERIGATVMGKSMFERGEQAWPQQAPFRTPVSLLAHAPREPWARRSA